MYYYKHQLILIDFFILFSGVFVDVNYPAKNLPLINIF